jgi:hypothetical protein
MKIVFSDHAMEQLEIRPNITKTMIHNAIHKPDKIKPSYRDRKIYRKRHGRYWLEIVTVKEDNKHIIITQYLLEVES